MRAGIARSTWDRIERGDPGAALATLTAAAEVVGMELVVKAYPASEPRLRDSGQLRAAQVIVSSAAPTWRSTLEVPAGPHGRAIDLVLERPDEVIAIEIERVLVDWQAQFRRATLKRDWLAHERSCAVRLLIVVEDSKRNRLAVAPFLPLIRTSLPAGSRMAMSAIRSGTALGSDGLVWLRPTGSRVSADESAQKTRLDGDSHSVARD